MEGKDEKIQGAIYKMEQIGQRLALCASVCETDDAVDITNQDQLCAYHELSEIVLKGEIENLNDAAAELGEGIEGIELHPVDIH